MERDIAIVVLNYIQYINIIPGIKELIKKGYKVDFYCPSVNDAEGFKEMFDDARKLLIEQNYQVYDKSQNIKYKVLLEPYPELNFSFDAKYLIKYRYGNISAKPSIVYIPKYYVKYDCILCAGEYDANYLNVFTRTVKTGNMKYINFEKKKERATHKKNLLYLPTYGNGCSIDSILIELNKLRNEYNVITKIHHGTSFLKNEQERIDKIKKNVDEFYDYHKKLSELLEVADVVLTDNSGSIFEAIYTEIPVAVYCDDINKFKLEDFNATQYELVEDGILPYTNDVRLISKILKQAQTKKYYKKQVDWNRKNFYHPTDLTKDFVNIIEEYLHDNINNRYFEMHNVLKKDYYNDKDNLIKLSEELEKQKQESEKVIESKDKEIIALKIELTKEKEEKEFLNNRLNYYKNGKLYKIANKIYKIKNGGK